MTSSLSYDGTLTAALSVHDLDKAIAWYSDVLGFSLLYKVEDMGWAELATEMKGINIGLSQVEKVQTQGGATLTFGVRDVHAVRAMLEAKQVRFDGETQVVPGMVAVATFFDPDGNVLMCAQDLSRSDA